MKVKEFIEILQQYDPELKVKFIWDKTEWDAQWIFRSNSYLGIQVTTRYQWQPEVYKNYPYGVEIIKDNTIIGWKKIDLDASLPKDDIDAFIKKEILAEYQLNEGGDFSHFVFRLPDNPDDVEELND